MADTIKLLKNSDVMRLMGIRSNKTLKKLRQNGLSYTKIGASYRYTQDQVNDFIKKNSSENI